MTNQPDGIGVQQQQRNFDHSSYFAYIYVMQHVNIYSSWYTHHHGFLLFWPENILLIINEESFSLTRPDTYVNIPNVPNKH